MRNNYGVFSPNIAITLCDFYLCYLIFFSLFLTLVLYCSSNYRDNFCYRQVKRVITIWEAIDKSPRELLQYWKNKILIFRIFGAPILFSWAVVCTLHRLYIQSKTHNIFKVSQLKNHQITKIYYILT